MCPKNVHGRINKRANMVNRTKMYGHHGQNRGYNDGKYCLFEMSFNLNDGFESPMYAPLYRYTHGRGYPVWYN